MRERAAAAFVAFPGHTVKTTGTLIAISNLLNFRGLWFYFEPSFRRSLKLRRKGPAGEL
jgi:hypothetical protein